MPDWAAMTSLAAILANLGLSQRLSRTLAVLMPLALLAALTAALWLRGDHYREQRDTARAQVETVNAKLTVSNASIAELQASLAQFVGAGKAAKVAQLAAVEAQVRDNAELQAQADAIRTEVAKGRSEGCASPEGVMKSKGL